MGGATRTAEGLFTSGERGRIRMRESTGSGWIDLSRRRCRRAATAPFFSATGVTELIRPTRVPPTRTSLPRINPAPFETTALTS